MVQTPNRFQTLNSRCNLAISFFLPNAHAIIENYTTSVIPKSKQGRPPDFSTLVLQMQKTTDLTYFWTLVSICVVTLYEIVGGG